MPQDVAIVFVHGINATTYDYADRMRDRLIAALPKKLRAHATFRSVFWADIVRGRQQQFLQVARDSSNIRVSKWRRFVVEGLGDAAAYQKTRNRDNAAYYQIQGRITEKLKEADNHGQPAKPLVFIGHSLGCHIISSYAWDINRLKQMSDVELAEWNDPEAGEFVRSLRTWSPLRRLDTFAGFVTLGSNMPLFTFTFGPDRVFPITKYSNDKYQAAFPGSSLPAAIKAKSRWLNFYSRNDLLGFPLKPLNSAYHSEPLLEDKEVEAEGFLRARFWPGSLNAMQAHIGYWHNRTVVRESAKLIRDLIEADPASPPAGASAPGASVQA